MKSHKKPKIINHPDDGFAMRNMRRMDNFTLRNLTKTYRGGKKAVIKHGTTSIIPLIVSSIIPMLEQWHSDKQYKDEIIAVGVDPPQQQESLNKGLID